MNLKEPIASRVKGLTGPWLIYTAVLLLIGAKWLLIGQNEIVSEPYDAHEYVLISENISAGGGGKSIGYPLWLSVTSLSGVPQRLVIEGFWALSCTLFSISLARQSRRRWLLPVSLMVLLFTPITAFLFDRALTEGFFLCLTVLLAAASLYLISARGTLASIVASLAAGSVAGVMLITRNETPLVLVYFALLAAAWILLQRTHYAQTWRNIGPRLLLVIIAIAIATSLPYTLAALQNKRRHGVFTVNLAEMSSHMGMLKRLAQIDTGTRNQRFIPISRAAREMAYAVSPGLAPFKRLVEDPTNIYQTVTHDTYGTTGEIGAGWIWHVFNQTAPAIGVASPAALHARYSQINRELDDAFGDGRLKQRFVPHPFLGANTTGWLKFLPEGIARSLRCVISPTKPMLDQDYASETFDQACLRRQSLIPRSLLHIKGWAFAHGDGKPAAISQLIAEFTDGTTRQLKLSALPRHDIYTGFAAQGVESPANAGFEATATAPSPLASLTFVTQNGTRTIWAGPAVGKAVSLTTIAGKGNVEIGLDQLSISMPAWSTGVRRAIFDKLMWMGSSITAWVVTLLCIIFVLASRSARPRQIRITPLLAGTVLFLAWGAGRVIFYAIITAGAWQAETRYLQPATVLILCAVLTACACATEPKNITQTSPQ